MSQLPARSHEDTLTASGTYRDGDDDKLLALAMTGQADEIVSGDNDLPERVTNKGIPILTPAECLRHLQDLQDCEPVKALERAAPMLSYRNETKGIWRDLRDGEIEPTSEPRRD